MERGVEPRGPATRGFRSLRAWQLADDLASLVFHSVEQLPPRHQWLASQMLRAAIAVPASIAEGYSRGSEGEYLRFLDTARGSLAEIEYYIHFVNKEALISADACNKLDQLKADCGRLLYGLWNSVKSKESGRNVREDRATQDVPV